MAFGPCIAWPGDVSLAVLVYELEYTMARVTVEDCLEVVENRFALVLLASARTRQLMKGSRSLIDGYKNNEQVLALREIAAKKVRFNRSIKEVLESSLTELDREYETAHGMRV
jgi:DNA-directed RNA polymerase subunit omega